MRVAIKPERLDTVVRFMKLEKTDPDRFQVLLCLLFALESVDLEDYQSAWLSDVAARVPWMLDRVARTL